MDIERAVIEKLRTLPAEKQQVERIYLVEKGKIPNTALDRLKRALAEESAAFERVPLDRAIVGVVERLPREVVPDLPDRIIAATALHLGLPLVTRDTRIRALGIETMW
jgi:predicted nucleic acid-binding protein